MKKYAAYQLRDIDRDLWTNVKVTAATRGITIRQLIIEAIKAYLLIHD